MSVIAPFVTVGTTAQLSVQSLTKMYVALDRDLVVATKYTDSLVADSWAITGFLVVASTTPTGRLTRLFKGTDTVVCRVLARGLKMLMRAEVGSTFFTPRALARI